MTLFLAEGSAGEYDDFHTWVVGVFSTRSKAKAACKSPIKPVNGTGKLAWIYNAKTGVSTALIKFSRWESGQFAIRRVEVDQVIE